MLSCGAKARSCVTNKLRMPKIQEPPASMVQRGEGTKRRVVKTAYLADYV